MKLVAIMSVDEYGDVLEHVYTEHRIPVFSEMDIEGYRLEDVDADRSNWFGRAHTSVYSKLTWALVSDAQADVLLDAIETYNRDHELTSPIRAFEMVVGRTV